MHIVDAYSECEREREREDMSSSSMASSLTCGSNDSVNGLKFGMKVYIEDVNTGGGGGSSSNASSSTPSKKGKEVVQGVQQAPRCQVEGCFVDLSDAKAYYSRHKVCAMHSKSPKVIVAGLEQRFCQQCSRFHQLPEFDQGKRSCRRRLAGHNERRRKPPPGSLLSRMGRFSLSFQEDSNRFRGYMMDFSYARLAGRGRNAMPVVQHGYQFHPYMQGSAGETLFPAGGGSPAGVSDSICALSLLSNHQYWSSNITARNMLQPEPVMAGSCFASNSWDFKDHGTDGSSEGLQLQLHTEMVNSNPFSSELELALQGNKAFDLSDDANHNRSL